MGIKFLSFQMIPWCFHLMGTRISCLQLRSAAEPPEPTAPAVPGTIKLIKSDGVVKTYHRPVLVSDLMAEFPKHSICRSDSFYIGRKIDSLPEHDRLQIGEKYFLLPTHFFQSVLSFVTVASFAAAAAATAATKKARPCPPFDIQKTASGCVRIRVSDEFVAQLMEEGRSGEEGLIGIGNRVCTTAELEKEYERLAVARRWRPKLEPIKEAEKKRRRRFGGSFRRKKSGAHHNQRFCEEQQQLHGSVGVKAWSKTKIKAKWRRL